MMKLAVIAALAGSASAFAPSSNGKTVHDPTGFNYSFKF